MSSNADRRMFLKLAGAGVAAGWFAARWPEVLAAGDAAARARDSEAGYTVLDPADAADLAALAECIIPSGNGPGAREAGVIWFMDAALGGFMAGARDSVLAGLESLNRRAGEAGLPARFALLAPDQQVQMITAIETEAFFETARFMTLAGMFAMPDHGGNRRRAGWALIGMEHAHGWQPPFGHYDKEAAGSGTPPR